MNEHWTVTKPAVASEHGVVAAQHLKAAAIGARILRDGGNAVDAAVATGFALAVLEPWMSGLGGGGLMVIYLAADRQVRVVDFAMVAPRSLDPAAFPLTANGSVDSDLFGWPAVLENRNVKGPLSIAVPGAVDGFGLALEHYGTRSWAETLEPAIKLSRQGHPVTWWTTLKVAGDAKALAENRAARAVYLPSGMPPVAPESGAISLSLGALPKTLERLAAQGRRDFYEGDLAHRIAEDMSAVGGVLSLDDLAGYRAQIAEPLTLSRNRAAIHLTRGLTAGPSFAMAMNRLPEIEPGPPGPEAYAGYAQALTEAYAERLRSMGHDGDHAGQGSTTHFSVIDRDGNMVSCTNTLLSLFGAKVLLPDTGIMMNNGIMWFDPRPGRPNSIAAGKRPLSNMCPLVVTRDGEPWFALGASGGRRILPAVFQLTSFLVDSGLSVDDAMMLPRVNIEGPDEVEANQRLPQAVIDAIGSRLRVTETEAQVSPNKFANPQIALRENGRCLGAAQILAPHAAAVAV